MSRVGLLSPLNSGRLAWTLRDLELPLERVLFTQHVRWQMWAPRPACLGQSCQTACPMSLKGGCCLRGQEAVTVRKYQIWTQLLPVSWNLRAGALLETGKEVDYLLIRHGGGNEMSLSG